jgi:hypothetical protein
MPKPPALALAAAFGSSVAISRSIWGRQAVRRARKAHPALLVADLPALIARFARLACHKNDEPLDGFLRVYADDPFGNRIEFLEPSPK